MPVSGPAASARRALRIEGHPIAVLVVASLAVGIASLLLSSAPTTDPWGWIVWGRQITHLDLNTVAGPPSWKPLPVLFTTPLSVLGGAAPAAWLVIARASSLLALGLAYRLGARLAGPAAGVVALVSLLLMQEWLSDAAFGYSEGLAVALLLWAVISHLEGRYTRALTLGFLVSLSRPEAWAFFFPYAAFTCLTGRSRRSVAIGLAIASPLLWVLPDWWGSGDPFHAAHVAGVNLAAAGAYPGLGVLRGALGLVALPSSSWRSRPSRSRRAAATRPSRSSGSRPPPGSRCWRSRPRRGIRARAGSWSCRSRWSACSPGSARCGSWSWAGRRSRAPSWLR